MEQSQQKLLEILASRNWLSPDWLSRIQNQAAGSDQTLEEILLAENSVAAEKLTQIKAELLALPPANLLKIPRRVLNLIPWQVALNYQMVPFERRGRWVYFGLVNPRNFKALEVATAWARQSQFKIRHFIISSQSFARALEQYQAPLDFSGQLTDLERQVVLPSAAGTEEESTSQIFSVPINKIALIILQHALDGRASDIHIEPTRAATQIRYRRDGHLATSLVLPALLHEALVAEFKKSAHLDLAVTDWPQTGRFRLALEGRAVDFELSSLPLWAGEKLVLKIFDSLSALPDLAALGFSQPQIELMAAALNQSRGLILLADRRRGARAQTLYALLGRLNRERLNIIVLENSLQYYLPGINQCQLQPELGYGLTAALESVLAQAPDVIALEEIVDPALAELALSASLTQGLLIAGIHAADSMSALEYLLALGLSPEPMAAAINLVISQRWVRRLCPDCQTPAVLSPNILKKFIKFLADVPVSFRSDLNLDNLKFWQASGCASCGNSGYCGRLVVAEIMLFSPALRDLISRGFSPQALKAELKHQNFVSLSADGLLKAAQGLTSLEELVANDLLI